MQRCTTEAINQECWFVHHIGKPSCRPVDLFFMSVILFLRFTTLESRLADLLSANVELNRNVPSVCVASCSTVRVSGGLKSSWGRVVRRHSSVTFLSCYSHQTALNNQSLFAEIRIGLHWNAAEHLAPDKISQNTDAWEFFFIFTVWPKVCGQPCSCI